VSLETSITLTGRGIWGGERFEMVLMPIFVVVGGNFLGLGAGILI
jgi:hypothetical protein